MKFIVVPRKMYNSSTCDVEDEGFTICVVDGNSCACDDFSCFGPWGNN